MVRTNIIQKFYALQNIHQIANNNKFTTAVKVKPESVSP